MESAQGWDPEAFRGRSPGSKLMQGDTGKSLTREPLCWRVNRTFLFALALGFPGYRVCCGAKSSCFLEAALTPGVLKDEGHHP